MPFPMKIQPLDSQLYQESIRYDSGKPAPKSRLRRLFDRQFPSVIRISSAIGEQLQFGKDVADFEPSSVCLAKMVQNFIEEANEKPSVAAAKCGRSRCNCFNANVNDSSDDEFQIAGFGDSIATDSLDSLKSLIQCASISERNLLADASKIIEKNKSCQRKDDLRKILTDDLLLLGYDASICKSRWEKSPSYPAAGEYEYIDVIIKRERLLIDIDFKSEFEIARSTGSYKTILQALPTIFVGKADRLHQMILTISEAARQSLKKKGMHIPPWRKAEYMTAKWLSPHTRITSTVECHEKDKAVKVEDNPDVITTGEDKSESGEMEEMSENTILWSRRTWKPPAVSVKNVEKRDQKVVTGLASLFREKL